MSDKNENARLETFCDGVFAIAITLLILEIKIPPVSSVHSIDDLWIALGNLWPSFFAFGLSFLIILIGWVNHHASFKYINKSSPQFLYVNGFLMLTIVLQPFATGLMAEYIKTDYAKPAIILFNVVALIQSFAWMFLAKSMKRLAKDEASAKMIEEGKKYSWFGPSIRIVLTALAWWFPYLSLALNTILWIVWFVVGISFQKDKKPVTG